MSDKPKDEDDDAKDVDTSETTEETSAEAEQVEEATEDSSDETDGAEDTAEHAGDDDLSEDVSEAETAEDTSPQDEAVLEDAPHDEVHEDHHDDHHEEHHEDHHEEHASGGSMAARLLTWLVLLIVGGGAALWGAPKLAPHLPSGLAPVAAFLTPGASEAKQEVAELETSLTDRFSDLQTSLTERVEGLSQSIDAQLADAPTLPSEEDLAALLSDDIAAQATAATEAVRSDIVGEIGALANKTNGQIGALSDQIATINAGGLDSRIAGLETRIEGFSAQLSSLGQQIDGLALEGGEFSEEASAALARFNATVDGIRAEVAEMSGQTGTLTSRIEAAEAAAERQVAEAEARAAAAEEEAAAAIARVTEEAEAKIAALLVETEEAVETAREEADQAKTAAELRAAYDVVVAAVDAGTPFPEAAATLQSDEALSSLAEPLVVTADNGVAELASLQDMFPDAALTAIRASVKGEESESVAGNLASFIESRITTRSLTPQEGDDADAVLSRAEAALKQGDLDAALSEMDALPEAATAAMGSWIDAAKARQAALAALSDIRQALSPAN